MGGAPSGVAPASMTLRIVSRSRRMFSTGTRWLHFGQGGNQDDDVAVSLFLEEGGQAVGADGIREGLVGRGGVFI